MSEARGRRATVGLLFAAALIVAADKSVFAFAGAHIMDDLQLTPAAFGMLGSAFFLLYSLSGVAFGFMANRHPARTLLLVMALIWGACQLGVALGSSFAALLACRVLLGVGAGPSTAMVQHACFKWFAPRARVLPASAMNSALMVGILLSAVGLPWLIAHHGWRDAYLVLAIASLGWALAWLLFGREGREPADATAPTATPLRNRYRDLLGDRTFMSVTAIGFAGYLLSGLGFSWTPTWLQKGLGFGPQQSGILVMLTMLATIAAMLGVSTLSQRWLKRGAPTRRALVLLPVGCCALGAGALLVLAVPGLPPAVRLALAAAGMVLLNIQQGFGVTVCGEIVGGAQRGALLAIHVACITAAGIVAPALAGGLVTAAGGDIAVGFERTLVLIGAATLALALACLRWARPQASRDRLALLRGDVATA